MAYVRQVTEFSVASLPAVAELLHTGSYWSSHRLHSSELTRQVNNYARVV